MTSCSSGWQYAQQQVETDLHIHNNVAQQFKLEEMLLLHVLKFNRKHSSVFTVFPWL